MIRRQTPLGGYCSVIAIILVLYLVITLTLPFSMDNIIETRSLIPNVANTKVISGDIIATGKLNGYVGGCVMPNTANTCVPGITVSLGDGQNFVNALNATWTCQNLTDVTYRAGNSSSASACEVTWMCHECSVPIKDTVTFNYLADNTFSSGIEWSFTSTSGYPGQVSRIYGSVMSGDDTLLRGVTTPTNVELYLTQTLYTESYSSVVSTGYHLNFADRTLGDTTAPINFYSTNGVKLSFSLELQLDTMNIERAQKQTTIQFIGSLLGSISGVIGGVAVLLGKSEDVEDFAFAKSNEFIAKSSRGRLNSLFEENDNRVIERAQKFLIDTHGNPANSAVAFQARKADATNNSAKPKPMPASSAIHPYRQKQVPQNRTETAKLSASPAPSPSTVTMHRTAQDKDDHGSNNSTSESDRSQSSSEVRPKSAASTLEDHATALPSATLSSRPATAGSMSRNTTRIHTRASPPPLPPALGFAIPPALPPWNSAVYTAESIRNAVSPFAPNSPSEVSPALNESYESSEEARTAAFRLLALEPKSSPNRSDALGVLLQAHPTHEKDDSTDNHRL